MYRQRLKQCKILYDASISVSKAFLEILYAASPILASKYLYRRNMGKSLNLNNPQTFNEKLHWLKLYWKNPLITECTDKYAVRNYIRNCGCAEILNELYGMYEHVSEIEWGNLPDKFALKCTHGCGCNTICNDKAKLNKAETIKQLTKWLKTKYDRIAAEPHYAQIKPRIICEKYLETTAGLLPNDYKIYCFNGEPKIMLVCTERRNKLKLDFLNFDWERIDIASEEYNLGEIPPRPSCFNLMINYAKKLSRPFPFVRVDFYDYNSRPIFGEMTFTPAACNATYYNAYGQKMLGSMLRLPR